MRLLLLRCFVASLLLAPLHGFAADPTPSPQVQVATLRKPVDKSYRNMIAGMDLFEEIHHMAPKASLRYRLLPRRPGVDMDGIVLKVVANSVSMPIPQAADNTFTLERNATALAEDASVISNRKVDSMTWRTMVRTPGLPDNVRRLGDVRLECIIGMVSDLVSHYPSEEYTREQRRRARRGVHACDDDNIRYLLFAERSLYSVTLRDGNRTAVVSFRNLYAGGPLAPDVLVNCECQSLQDKSYHAPIADKSWSDNTLIELEYMDSDPVPTGDTDAVQKLPIVIGKSTQAEVAALIGKETVVAFDNGYAVWKYSYAVDAPDTSWLERQAELVILFGPDGVVKKLRRREPLLKAAAAGK